MVARASLSLSMRQYTPGPAPASPAELQRYVYDELLRISAVISLMAGGHLDMSQTMPTRVEPGDYYYFGADINPGSGEGFYFYNSDDQWIQMG